MRAVLVASRDARFGFFVAFSYCVRAIGSGSEKWVDEQHCYTRRYKVKGYFLVDVPTEGLNSRSSTDVGLVQKGGGGKGITVVVCCEVRVVK